MDSLKFIKNQSDLYTSPLVEIRLIRGPDNQIDISKYNLLYAYNIQLSFLLNLLPSGLENMYDNYQMIMNYRTILNLLERVIMI